MGRTLQNTMVNLGLENACDEATYQVRQRIMAKGQRRFLKWSRVKSTLPSENIALTLRFVSTAGQKTRISSSQRFFH